MGLHPAGRHDPTAPRSRGRHAHAGRGPGDGAEVILAAGDWLLVEDAVRNAGDDDVVLLIAGLTRIGEPFTTFDS